MNAKSRWIAQSSGLDRRRMLGLCAATVASLSLPGAKAQTGGAYPSRPIRLVLPAAPGGTGDALARVIALELAKNVGQSVVIDNRTGAAGIVGTELAANSAPDGYSVLVGTAGAMVVNPSLYLKLPYDSIKSFDPVVIMAFSPLMLIANPALPIKTIGDLIALAKSKPGQLTYASAGSGSTPHLAGELFRLMTGVDMLHVPYKGSTPGVTAVMSGEASVMFTGISSCLGQVKAGKLRGVSVNGVKRSLALPDVPTAIESGLPGFVADFWYGAFVPAGTPRAVVTTLNAEVNKILNLAEIRDKLVNLGLEPGGGTPEQLGETVRKDRDRWADVVKTSGMKAD